MRFVTRLGSERALLQGTFSCSTIDLIDPGDHNAVSHRPRHDVEFNRFLLSNTAHDHFPAEQACAKIPPSESEHNGAQAQALLAVIA